MNKLCFKIQIKIDCVLSIAVSTLQRLLAQNLDQNTIDCPLYVVCPSQKEFAVSTNVHSLVTKIFYQIRLEKSLLVSNEGGIVIIQWNLSIRGMIYSRHLCIADTYFPKISSQLWSISLKTNLLISDTSLQRKMFLNTNCVRY